MAKQRYVNTRFWSDNYVSGLKPLERYLFLYFLTNEHTNIGGIYELPLRNIAFETDLKESMILEAIQKFTKAGKVFYIEGWVYVKNFSKHQAVNEKTQKGIENSLKEVAPNVLAKIKEIDMGTYTPSIPHQGSTNYLNRDLNLNSNRERKPTAYPISYLKNIPVEDLKELTTRFLATNQQILGKAEDLVNWCEANGKTKTNYRAFLLTALRKDFKERTPEDEEKALRLAATLAKRTTLPPNLEAKRNSLDKKFKM